MTVTNNIGVHNKNYSSTSEGDPLPIEKRIMATVISLVTAAVLTVFGTFATLFTFALFSSPLTFAATMGLSVVGGLIIGVITFIVCKLLLHKIARDANYTEPSPDMPRSTGYTNSKTIPKSFNQGMSSADEDRCISDHKKIISSGVEEMLKGRNNTFKEMKIQVEVIKNRTIREFEEAKRAKTISEQVAQNKISELNQFYTYYTELCDGKKPSWPFNADHEVSVLRKEVEKNIEEFERKWNALAAEYFQTQIDIIQKNTDFSASLKQKLLANIQEAKKKLPLQNN